MYYIKYCGLYLDFDELAIFLIIMARAEAENNYVTTSGKSLISVNCPVFLFGVVFFPRCLVVFFYDCPVTFNAA
jgi:hypothetical protein